MPLYALIDGVRQRATPAGARRACCADCGTRMIAKTGTTVIHHWAHESEQPGCEAGYEGPWHLEWKSLGIDGTQEIAVGNRRADVLAPGGFAVEFQQSPMTPEEVHDREADWKGKLVWIFDAREAYAEGRLALRRHPDRDVKDAYRNMSWSHAPVRIKAATCRSLLDLDGERLIFVGKWYDRSPMQGYGWEVTQDWCVAYVIQGDKIHEPPGFGVPVDSARVAARASVRRLSITGKWVSNYHQKLGNCPLCHGEHDSCVFASGSLFCVSPACQNPHHRARTPSAVNLWQGPTGSTSG